MNPRHEDREARDATQDHQHPESIERAAEPRHGAAGIRRDGLESLSDRLGKSAREDEADAGRSQCGEHQPDITPAITVRFFATVATRTAAIQGSGSPRRTTRSC